MKYKVIDLGTLDTETLQRMLDEVYNEGFRDGYHKSELEKPIITTTPYYDYDRYKTYEITCDSHKITCDSKSKF